MDNPIVQVNGPLWTLQYEWSFYIVIMLLAIFNSLQGRVVLPLLFLTSLIVTRYFGPDMMPNLYWPTLAYIAPFFLYFGLGAMAYLYRGLLPTYFSSRR